MTHTASPSISHVLAPIFGMCVLINYLSNPHRSQANAADMRGARADTAK
jgi:hypothetical protein